LQDHSFTAFQAFSYRLSSAGRFLQTTYTHSSSPMGAISSDAGQPGSSNMQAMCYQAPEQADAAGFHCRDRDQAQQGSTVAARDGSSDDEPAQPMGCRAKFRQIVCAPTGTAQK
jgi:hypothetical protein